MDKLKEKQMTFRVQDYLKDEEDCRLYLKACCMEDVGDGKLIETALEDIAHAGYASQLSKEESMARADLGKASNP